MQVFWLRLGAQIVDGIIIGIASKIFELFPDILTLILLLALLYFYHIHLIYKYGRTPGKTLAKIRVVSTTGKAVTWKQVFLRVSPYIVFGVATVVLSVIPLLSALAGVLLFVWYIASAIVLERHPQKRTIHDLIAGTMVIKY